MDERPLDLAVLRTFSPLDGLKAENLHALARKTHIRELGAGRVLFKEGDTDKRTFYLVAGNVELRADDRIIGTIRAGGSSAKRGSLATCRICSRSCGLSACAGVGWRACGR